MDYRRVPTSDSECARLKPGQIMAFWSWHNRDFENKRIDEISRRLAPCLGIKHYHGNDRENFYVIFKKKGWEK